MPGSPVSHHELAARLRKRILRGTLLPGAQLPTLRSIADSVSASPVTAQRALHQLRREGFIYSNGRLGNFVASRPPHLSRYALVFPVSEKSVHVSRFWESLYGAAMAVEKERPGTFHIAYDIGPHRETKDFVDLLQRLETGSIAGIIFASNPCNAEGSLLLTQPHVARAAIMTHPLERIADPIPAVYDNVRDFVTRSLDYLARRGCKRLALIGPPLALAVSYAELVQLGAARGIEIPAHMIQLVTAHATVAARQAAMLLSHPGLHPRPNSLLILDDHFVQDVTEGLRLSGCQVRPAPGTGLASPSREAHAMDVVGLCHFANPPENPLGFALIGFDADQLLCACVEQIVHQRRREKTRALTLVPARFAFEPPSASRIPEILEQLLSVEPAR